jgi:di/tricarboxylate transporter
MTQARSATIFLQIVVVLIGIGVLALMLWEPHLEGRNAHATTFEIYFKDPFLAYAYTASIAFFVALFQAFRLLGYIGQNEAFSPNAVRALRTIKYCAIVLVAMIGAAVAYLFLFVRGKDDIAGGVAMGVAMIFVSMVIAAAAAVFERLLQNAVDRNLYHG